MLMERLHKARAVLKPSPKLNLWEWADEYRYLSSEASSSPGKWKTSKVEAARGPMEAVTDPDTHIITVMCCTQFMKTELLLNTIGFFTHQDPSPIIVMQPTIHAGEAFSKDRLDPMFRDSPELCKIMPPKKTRDGGNTILHKQFPGGHITIVGSNAPGDLAMRPVRIVLCDETDKYPGSAGDEGDPIAVLGERSATFWNWKQIRTCSPTLEPTEDGAGSRIAMSYEESDKRIFCPACPHCGHREEMLWAAVEWPVGHPELALYHCPECHVPWTEPERKRAIKATRDLPNRGWVATAPFKGHAGFRVSKLASPWESIAKLAEKWEAAQKSPELLKVFVNTQLAETWKDKGEAPDWKRLYNRRDPLLAMGVVPLGGVVLIGAADVQRTWIEVTLYAYGRNMERWVVDHRQFHGDTSDETLPNSPWKELEKLRESYYPHESHGVAVPVRMLAVDSGDQTQTVYRWCAAQPQGSVMAVKGIENGDLLVSAAKPIQIKSDGKKAARSTKLWLVSQNIAKQELYAQLRVEAEPGQPLPRGYIHFPELEQEFFEQLCAEQMMTRRVKGRTKTEWVKTRLRNEVFDCTLYSRAAAYVVGLDRYREENWVALEKQLGIGDLNKPVTIENNRDKPKPKRESFWKNR